jgi:tetratricopeptide (TPR) repeat protein
LNFYKRAKLANSFKWRLIENGVKRATADEVTQTLVLNLSMSEADPPATAAIPSAVNGRRSANNVKQLFAQGNRCMDQGAYIEAIDIFQRLLEVDPHHAMALNNIGAALSKLSQYQKAERLFRAAIKERPDFVDAHSNLGMVLRWQGFLNDSEKSLRNALRLNPSHVDARTNLGTTLALLNRLREAKGQLKKALKAEPRNAEALFAMGQIASLEGRFDESEKTLNRALQARPKMPVAWAALSGLRKMTAADAAWLRGAEEIIADRISPSEAATMHFAMGKYHDDMRQFGEAFKHFRGANELLKPVADKYDRAARAALVDDLIRIHPREAIGAMKTVVSASMKPVFVMGMMRSGTSLTEQIIASHPQAAGAGELDYWSTVVREHGAAIREGLFLSDESAMKSVTDNYLRILEQASSTALRVVDKTPVNCDYLGIIHSVFPQARIIYMRRDPLDTCLSCYFQNLSLAQSFALDLSDLAHYYQEHQRLMDHWRRALPQGTILEVPYEELLTDQEGWTRKILSFLELEWDPRCLDFQSTDRPIVTASFWQARQKIYTTSVSRWHNYEKFVEPLLPLKKLDS